jgi:hypothetical protein
MARLHGGESQGGGHGANDEPQSDHAAIVYAQVLTEGTTSDRCGELDAAIRDRLLPSLRVQEGFCGALHLVNRHDGIGMLVVLWETEEQADWAASLPEIAALTPVVGSAVQHGSVWEVTQRA